MSDEVVRKLPKTRVKNAMLAVVSRWIRACGRRSPAGQWGRDRVGADWVMAEAKSGYIIRCNRGQSNSDGAVSRQQLAMLPQLGPSTMSMITGGLVLSSHFEIRLWQYCTKQEGQQQGRQKH